MISVHRIRPGDGVLLRQVRLAALLDTPSAFGSTHAAESDRPDAEWDARAAGAAEGDDRAMFFAVDEHDGVVGLAGGFREGGATNLVSMWTDPTARCRGVGRALVQAVLDWADDDVSLWVTRGNDAAHALYESMGFVDTDEIQPLPSDPCKDEVRMIRRR